MKERDLHSLLDILLSAKLALRYITGKSCIEFTQDIQLQDSVVRRLEIIGEASRRISEETRLELTQIPWKKIIGMRNKIIHEYDKVNSKIVWNILQDDLPFLIEELEKFVPNEQK